MIFNLFDLDRYRINIELIGFYWPLSIEFIIEFQVLTRENTISGVWTCLSVDKRIPGAEGRAPSTPSRLTRSRRPSASRSTDTWEPINGAFLCTMWIALLLDGSQKDRKRIANGEMKEFSKGGIFHLSFFYPLLSFFYPFSILFSIRFLSFCDPILFLSFLVFSFG